MLHISYTRRMHELITVPRYGIHTPSYDDAPPQFDVIPRVGFLQQALRLVKRAWRVTLWPVYVQVQATGNGVRPHRETERIHRRHDRIRTSTRCR